MATLSKLAFAALAASLFVANCASQASAQDSAARDAAIHKCILEAQARFPDPGQDESAARSRVEVYRSCMRAAGHNP